MLLKTVQLFRLYLLLNMDTQQHLVVPNFFPKNSLRSQEKKRAFEVSTLISHLVTHHCQMGPEGL